MIDPIQLQEMIELLKTDPEEFDRKVKELSSEYNLSSLEIIQEILEKLEPELKSSGY
jgi:hypothetical protein